MINYDAVRLFQNHIPVKVEPVQDLKLEDLVWRLGVGEEDLLKILDADPEELKSRQEMFKWAIHNYARLSKTSFIERFDKNSETAFHSFPQKSIETFLIYFDHLKNQATSFWVLFDRFMKALSFPTPYSGKIHHLLYFLERESRILFLEEIQLAEDMLVELRSVANIHGLVRVSLRKLRNFKPEHMKDISVCGTHNFHESSDLVYTQASKDSSDGIAGKFIEQLTSIKEKIQLSPAQISSTPDGVRTDIYDYLRAELFYKLQNKYPHVSEVEFILEYTLGQEGLSICFIDTKASDTHFSISQYPGVYFGAVIDNKKYASHLKQIAKYRQSAIDNQTTLALNRVIWEDLGLKGWVTINSNATVQECSKARNYQQVLHLYKERVENIANKQSAMFKFMQELYLLVRLSCGVIDSGLSYTFPEINDQVSGVELEQFLPARLDIGQEVMRPFKKFIVNGEILNLTGRNGSGKSTCLLSILDSIILAQCGMPIFGGHTKISPKDHVLLCFLDRTSDESTFNALLSKYMEINRTINQIPKTERSKVLVVIDEFGSATDQQDVMGILTRYVDWLSQQRVGVVFTTQITDLGKYLENNRLGVNLMVMQNGEILPGIAAPEPMAVAEERGFFETLRSDEAELEAQA